MTAAMRPMTLGEILDRTIQIYRSRFAVFAGIAAIPALAMTSIQAANAIWWQLYPWTRPGMFEISTQRLLYLVVFYQLNLLFTIAVWPVFARAVSRFLHGDTPAPRRRLRSLLWLALANWGAILLAPELVFFGLLAGLAFLLFEVIKIDPDNTSGPAMFFLDVALAWACSLWLMSRFSIAAASWQVEGLSAAKAMKRSWELSKGSAWRVLIASLVPAVLWSILLLALNWALLFTRSSCFDDDILYLRLKLLEFTRWSPGCMPLPFVEAIRQLVSTLISILVGPLFPIATTLIYYDQRIRKEGYDIERMMDAAGMSTPVAPAAVVANDSAEAEVQPG